jgi:trk system potassium uptake protein TrkH
MNMLLVCRLLGVISLLIGGSMAMSLPWALPVCGQTDQFETAGFLGLLLSMVVCGLVGGGLMFLGRSSRGQSLFRREAIAVVGLSWLTATLLGALPYWFSGTCGRVDADGQPQRMDIAEGIFESASGFSGTGASVLTNVEAPRLVPRAILFWRSETHFLGGLGIMVLFVAILGLGSAGKTLMVTEMPGPIQGSPHARTQHAAHVFAMIFVGLNTLLALALRLQGVSWYDAICHAFGTVATGGFSTYNTSVGHFANVGVEMTIVVFMVLGCTNFTLLYYLVLRQPGRLLGDVEFRTYILILLTATVAVFSVGLCEGDFAGPGEAARYGLFQVTSILTNTGFGTADFNRWNDFSRGLLLLLMFIGGCAGSTSCSVKVIRYILFFKILWSRLEQVFHPSVVRPVRIGGKPLEDPDVRSDVVLYVGVVLVISVVAWMGLLALEPDSTWTQAGRSAQDKLVDCGSAVAATINGVGPGLGIVGVTSNYSRLDAASKLVITALMLLGRLEVFVLVVLFMPRFWRGK